MTVCFVKAGPLEQSEDVCCEGRLRASRSLKTSLRSRFSTPCRNRAALSPLTLEDGEVGAWSWFVERPLTCMFTQVVAVCVLACSIPAYLCPGSAADWLFGGGGGVASL